MANSDTPKPTTAIPELVAMDLRDEEFDAVVAAVNAVVDDGVLTRGERGAARELHGRRGLVSSLVTGVCSSISLSANKSAWPSDCCVPSGGET